MPGSSPGMTKVVVQKFASEESMADANDSSMTRRGAQASAQKGTAKTFVLIHGAWHGGWCWRRVADLLEKQGHKVFAPTLTGLGERSHLMSKDINLDTHIADVVNVIKWEDLNNVCLVAHSYGGWPGSRALEQVGERVASGGFLDALLAGNGQKTLHNPSPLTPQKLAHAM